MRSKGCLPARGVLLDSAVRPNGVPKSFGECGGKFDEVELPGGVVPLEDGRLLMVNS